MGRRYKDYGYVPDDDFDNDFDNDVPRSVPEGFACMAAIGIIVAGVIAAVCYFVFN